MNALLDYLDDENAGSQKNNGYGLIGGYALVFLGIAVSRSFLRMIGSNTTTSRFPPVDIRSKCPEQPFCFEEA